MKQWIDPVEADAPRDIGSKSTLRPGAQRHYPSDSAFDRIARVVCRAGCLPRKELYESWEMAKRVRSNLRGSRVVDLACGHGLLAYALAVIMPAVSEIIAVDRRLPPSASRLREAMEAEWPELATRVTLHEADIRAFEIRANDIVVCAHGCGTLTDRVMDVALAAGADLAVLPCCADHSRQDDGALSGWVHPDLAIDVLRAVRLGNAGYKVWTKTIDKAITPKNRLLLGRHRHAARVPTASA